MTFFAKQLASMTTRTVKVAEHGEPVRANHIYVAPGDAHLVCRREGGKVMIHHLEDYSLSRYCPSVDAMLESVAQIYGARAMGIILSGMGNDGVYGARLLAAKNGVILVQDSNSSIVWGMPGTIAREGLATAVLDPVQITKLLQKIAGR